MGTNVNQYVKSFMDDYNVTQLTRDALGKIIQRMGYKIVAYNPAQTETAAAKLIDSIGIRDSIKNQQSFACNSGSVKFVFIDSTISEPDSIQLLLHEIGHIYMGHINGRQDDAAITAKNENEANQFALLVKQQVKRNMQQKRLLKYVRDIGITGAVMALFVGLIHSEHQPNTVAVRTVSTASQSTTIAAEQVAVELNTTPTEVVIEQDSGNAESFYITKSGEKYHRLSCNIIKSRNQDTLLSGSKEQFETLGYEPCSICIGN